MEETSTLKLIMEKGPREGEALEYKSRCVVKIGRVVRGNTIGIKDPGISAKHICIQFDNQLNKWILSDLGSSNGTKLNGDDVNPNVPVDLKDGDCIKIGEVTSMIVKIGVESVIQSERRPRRQGKSGAVAEAAAVVKREGIELGLGFDGDLGENAVEEPVEKRNLRSRGRKAVESAESLSSKRTLRNSKKVSSNPTLKQIPEDLIVDARETTDNVVPVEPEKKGRQQKVPVQHPDLDERNPADDVVPMEPKKKGRQQKVPVQLPDLDKRNPEDNVVPVEPKKKGRQRKVPVQLPDLDERNPPDIVLPNNEYAEDHVAEEPVLQEAMIDQSLVKDSTQIVPQVQETGFDNRRWADLEQMTLGDFFDYLEVQLPKEIYEKSEKIISDLEEKARKCHEFRLQRNKNEQGKGKA